MHTIVHKLNSGVIDQIRLFVQLPMQILLGGPYNIIFIFRENFNEFLDR
jgi:hypothetical protein